MSRSLLAGLWIVAVGGCFTDESICIADRFERMRPACSFAQVYAARDTAALVPHQSEVDRYFDRWSRAIQAEPVLLNGPPQHYRGWGNVQSTNPTVIAAWTRGQLTTGDPEFDAIFAQLRPSSLNENWSVNSGVHYFSLTPTVEHNQEVLHAQLVPLDSSLRERFEGSNSDGKWRWLERDPGSSGEDGDTAQIEVSVGWGDCLAGCIEFHYLRAVIPAFGDPVVYDLGGAPLPLGMELAPTTLPPPR